MTEPASSPSEAPQPVAIERDGDSAIVIQWDDGATTRWTARQLRDACPCATCREKRRGQAKDDPPEKAIPSMSLPVLSKAEAQPLRIEKMRPVGSYAYNIAFSDGHSSGIFPLETLRQ